MIELINDDCMNIMKDYDDNHFDLAIVDPPYGILNKCIRNDEHTKNKTKFHNLYSNKNNLWDFKPNKEYFDELFRVSRNQIICGGNYFCNHLPISRGWVIWDKQGEGMSSVNDELIWTSFDISIKKFSRCHGLDKGFMNKEGKNIHPTQKPVKLYEWLLNNYSEKGQKILDTHLGSGSIAIACHYFGVDLLGIEIDK